MLLSVLASEVMRAGSAGESMEMLVILVVKGLETSTAVVVLVVAHSPSPGRQSVGPVQTVPSLTVDASRA
jgi:hypothetical protein